MGKDFLVDTNIIVYYLKDEFPSKAASWLSGIFRSSFNMSIISKIEFLGWPTVTDDQYREVVQFLDSANVIPLSVKIADETVRIKRQRKIKLPDAVIAATCLVKHFTLVTRNSKDFVGLTDLAIYNPFEEI